MKPTKQTKTIMYMQIVVTVHPYVENKTKNFWTQKV